MCVCRLAHAEPERRQHRKRWAEGVTCISRVCARACQGFATVRQWAFHTKCSAQEEEFKWKEDEAESVT